MLSVLAALALLDGAMHWLIELVLLLAFGIAMVWFMTPMHPSRLNTNRPSGNWAYLTKRCSFEFEQEEIQTVWAVTISSHQIARCLDFQSLPSVWTSLHQPLKLWRPFTKCPLQLYLESNCKPKVRTTCQEWICSIAWGKMKEGGRCP